MNEDNEANQQDEETGDSEAVNREQGAALQELGGGQDEEQAETGEGILDHAEHSDAPGPHGTG